MGRLRVTRTAALPDPVRIARSERAPELGPRVLFFSGGNALRKVSRALKRLTHNSVHLITPFDSGGSSAVLREAFDMLSVGDLRNRIMALADESARGNPAIYALFSHRFGKEAAPHELDARIWAMVRGTDPLVAEVPSPMRRLVRTYLRLFAQRMPDDFDLRGASVGNLILAGGYLNNDRDMDSVVFLFSRLVEARGTVLPVVDAELHLAATLADGTRIVGQHRFTGKEHPPITSPIDHLALVSSEPPYAPAVAVLHEKVRRLIEGADLIVFPIGSFYSSLLATLLPRGVGAAVAAANCPKVYVPNTGMDPEQLEMTGASAVSRLLDTLRADAGADVAVQRLLNGVLVDTDRARYGIPLELEAIEALGIPVADARLVEDRPDRLHPERLSEALISLA